MKLLIICLGLFLSSESRATEVGFKVGSELQVIELSGRVSATCRSSENENRVFYDCFSNSLGNGNYSKLVVSKGRILADKVHLIVIHADGSTKKKSSRFNVKKGQAQVKNGQLEVELAKSELAIQKIHLKEKCLIVFLH